MATNDVRFVPIADEHLRAPMVLVRAATPGTPPASNFTQMTIAELEGGPRP